jgi:hypothetical protein
MRAFQIHLKMPDFTIPKGTRNKEQGTRNKEQGTRNKEQGTGKRQGVRHTGGAGPCCLLPVALLL